MNDRASAWRHLLPPGAVVEVEGSELGTPPSFRPALRTLLASGSPTRGRRSLEAYDCAVITSPPAGAAAELRRHGFGHVRSFAVLPGLKRARWYLPLGSPAVTRRALDLYTPSTRGGRAVRALGRALAGWGGGFPLGDRLVVAARGPSPLEAIGDRSAGGRPCHFALSLPHETGQRDRVWVLVIDDAGASIAFAKLAYRPDSIRRLEREVAITNQVGALGLRHVTIPAVVDVARTRETFLMVSAPIPAGSRESARHLGPAHYAALRELAGHTGPASTSELSERLARRCDLAAPDLPGAWRERLHRAIDAVRASPALRELPTVLAHGDFVPWNIRSLPNGLPPAVFDWEQGQESQFVLWDAFNFNAQVDIVLRRATATASVARAVRELCACPVAEAFRLTRDQVEDLQLAYLADASLRWFEAHCPASVWEHEMSRTRTQPMRAAMLDAALASRIRPAGGGTR